MCQTSSQAARTSGASPTLVAPRFCSSCATVVAPHTMALMPGWCSTHASARAGRLRSAPAAIFFNRSIAAKFTSFQYGLLYE
jgi:hypothetical protein